MRKSPLQIRLEYRLVSSLFWLLRVLPWKTAAALARVATQVLDYAIPKLRRVAEENLTRAMPELSAGARERLTDGVFRSIGRTVLALARASRLNERNIHELIEYDGLEYYCAAKSLGKGVLIATGHLGNWELSAYAQALMTEPMNVLVRPLDNPLVDEMVERLRAGSGNRIIAKRDAAKHILRALANNEAVGILVDQNTALNEGVFVRFFGRPACAGSAFARIAHHSGAPVIPGFALWDAARQKHVLRFYPPILISGDVVADTQRIQTVIEEVVRQYPDQWMWIHRRWKTQPPEPTEAAD